MHIIVWHIPRTGPPPSCMVETLHSLNNSHLAPLSPWQPHSTFCVYEFDYSFLVPHVSGIMTYLSFCDWLTSLSIMSSKRFILKVACDRISFLFKTETLYLLNSNSPFPTSPYPLATTILLPISVSLTTLVKSNWVMQDLSFCDWLITLSIMFSRLTHVACINTSLFFMADALYQVEKTAFSSWFVECFYL